MTDGPKKYPSGLTRLGLVDCPACGGGSREGLPVSCAVCKDAGKVSVPVATQWHLDQGKKTT